MSDLAAARELIARLERATGPDQELDEAIAVWRRPELATMPRAAIGGWLAPNGRIVALEYTSSLDAAVSLVPEGWQWWAGTEAGARVWLRDKFAKHDVARGWGATPALALCAAALNARVAEMEASDDR